MSKLWRSGAACCVTVLVCGVGACSSGDDAPAGADSAGSTTQGATASGSGGGDVGGSTPSTKDDETADGEATEDGSSAGGGAAQTTVLKRLPGPADGRCVPVNGRRDVRSGGLGAGAFDEAISSFRAQQRAGQPATVRLYFIPATGGTKLPGLVVTLRNTRTKDEQTIKQKTTSDADAWTFYDTQVPIPAPGEYEIRAASGDDTGCFRVEFR